MQVQSLQLDAILRELSDCSDGEDEDEVVQERTSRELAHSKSAPQLRSVKLRADPKLEELRRNLRLKAARHSVLQDPKCRLMLGLPPLSAVPKNNQSIHSLPTMAQRAANQRASSREKPGMRKKPEKEPKASGGQRRKTGKKRTVTMLFQGSDGAKDLPSPSWEKIGSLCASVQEALDRFYTSSGFIPDHEIKRMKICFQRFSSEDNDLYRGQVHEVLTHLCYIPVSEDKATTIAKHTNEFSTLDFQDFCDFVERYMQYEREVVRVKLEEWTTRDREKDEETDAVKEVRGFLKSLGIICLKDATAEIIELGGLSDRSCVRPEELLRCLAAYRAREGLTQAELNRISEVFETLEAEPQPKTAADMRSERHIKAGELCKGLLKFAGLYCAEHLRELLDKMEDTIEGEKITPFPFYEFVVCARRLKEMMLLAASEEFDNVDADEDGIVEGEELREFCKPLGFNLSAAEWEELAEEQNLSADDDIEFPDAWNFLHAVQAKNGFTAEEQQDLIEAFMRFSDSTGELQNLKVKDLLTYIGFETSVDEVQEMVGRVDFNGSKTMDQDEFLQLMRLQRETTLASYTAAYSRNRLFARGGATPEEISRVLALTKLHPNVKILDQALRLVEESGEYDRENSQSLQFEGFLKVADYCRKTIPVDNRRHAHFQLEQIADLRKSFDSQDSEKKGFISVGNFLWLLADTALSVNTAAGRARMYEQLERAREAAMEAGVHRDEVGSPNSPRVRFLPMVHFVYEIVKNHEDAVFSREDEALKGVDFSKDEVLQFRDLFATLVKQHETEVAASSAPSEKPIGRRLSAVQAAVVMAEAEEAQREKQQRELTLGSAIKRLTKVDRVPAADVIKMVTLMGIQANGVIKSQLFERCMHFSDKPSEGMDFAGFLQLMQWMVGTNFGNILSAAEQTVKSEGLRSDGSGTKSQGGLASLSKFGHMESSGLVRTRKYLV